MAAPVRVCVRETQTPPQRDVQKDSTRTHVRRAGMKMKSWTATSSFLRGPQSLWVSTSNDRCLSTPLCVCVCLSSVPSNQIIKPAIAQRAAVLASPQRRGATADSLPTLHKVGVYSTLIGCSNVFPVKSGPREQIFQLRCLCVGGSLDVVQPPSSSCLRPLPLAIPFDQRFTKFVWKDLR